MTTSIDEASRTPIRSEELRKKHERRAREQPPQWSRTALSLMRFRTRSLRRSETDSTRGCKPLRPRETHRESPHEVVPRPWETALSRSAGEHLLDMLGLEPEAAFGVRPGKLADLLSHVESLLDGGEVAAARADLARVQSACDALCMAQLDESPASLAAALAASLDSEDLRMT